MTTGPSANPVSPSSSPRLPSPPPLTEVQFGPKSPGSNIIGDNVSQGNVDESTDHPHDAGPTRRIRPGTKADEMASGPPLVPLSDLDSAFQLQEHLKSLYLQHTQPSHLDHTIPISKAAALSLSTPPDGIDRYLWLYELCRLLTIKLNTIIVAFFMDDPPCSATTCPEMRASEWQYLCAVHDPPKPCCAIDYCCHTLDWAAVMLTSTKHFPSRLTLGVAGGGGGDGGGNGNGNGNGNGGNGGTGQQQGLRNLTNICRRLYRIFAHAWYQHRSVFWQVESQMGLYVLFKTVCDVYQLIPEDNYTVPAEAEGMDGSEMMNTSSGATPMILKKTTASEGNGASSSLSSSSNRWMTEGASSSSSSNGSGLLGSNTGMITTRRHMSNLSIGSSSSSTPSMVTTVPEEDEEGEDTVQEKEDEGEGEHADVVVMVVEEEEEEEDDHHHHHHHHHREENKAGLEGEQKETEKQEEPRTETKEPEPAKALTRTTEAETETEKQVEKVEKVEEEEEEEEGKEGENKEQKRERERERGKGVTS